MAGELIQDHFGNEGLGLNVQFQLDVMRLERIHIERGAEAGPQQFSGCVGSGDGKIKRVHASDLVIRAF
jgi:hypothetical protein